MKTILVLKELNKAKSFWVQIQIISPLKPEINKTWKFKPTSHVVRTLRLGQLFHSSHCHTFVKTKKPIKKLRS